MDEVTVRPLRHPDDEGFAADVAAVAALAAVEEWPTFADPARLRALIQAPGTVTLVALLGSAPEPGVVGYAHALTNGHHGYLSTLAVDQTMRGKGIGRALVDAVFETTGIERMDLTSDPDSEGFYARLPSQRLTAFRLYPAQRSNGDVP